MAAWRLTLATLILTPVALVKVRGELKSLTRDEWIRALAAGLLLAVHFVSWILSLSLTTVAASVVLMTTHPIFAALGSYLLLDEPLGGRMIIALAVAVVGSGVIALGDLGSGSHQVLGDLLALLGGISAAGYFVLGRRLRARLSLLGYIYPVYGTAAVVLITTLLISGVPKVPERPEAWIWLGLMAAGPQVLGHSSLNWALRYLSATFVTLATLGEPIGSTLLAWWLLGEKPTVWAVFGGLLILGGIVVASRAERPGSATDHLDEVG